MIAPYAVGPGGEQPGSTYLISSDEFIDALTHLKAHVAARRELLAEFLR
jgi:hypothetical protein